jgi:DNA-binding NarL/FixJ family response regulator
MRILLIDDHALFREAVARMLAAQPDFEIAGEAATVEEGIAVIEKTPVDVVLLDINLGSQQGGAFLTQARQRGFQGKVLVVTAGVNQIEAARLFDRGCAGIFLKHERPQILMERIREIAAGTARELAPAPFHPAEPDARPALTPRERQVLRGVFAGRANKEIAFELGVSEPSVKAVLQRLFSKTGVRTRAQLVRLAVERYWSEIQQQDSEPA